MHENDAMENETEYTYYSDSCANNSTYGCYFEHPETAGDFYFSDERKNK